jgi:mevalonate kinase
MRDRPRIHPSKILLLGEYAIIYNSMALAVPFPQYFGKMNFPMSACELKENELRSNQILKRFYGFIVENKDKAFNQLFDFNSFKNDLEMGLYFDSNIPEGLGLGSSGAVCASVYQRYFQNSFHNYTESSDLEKIKEHLAFLESFFHGKSSGIDPLVSFFQKPLLFEQGQVKLLDLKFDFLRNIHVFLIDTQVYRKTDVWVSLFLKNCESAAYLKLIKEKYIPYNEACIRALLLGERDTFFEQLYQLSRFQFDHFHVFIPKSMVPIWKQGLDTGDYYLKLNGAGGGGTILGFTRNFESVKFEFESFLFGVVKGGNPEIIGAART